MLPFLAPVVGGLMKNGLDILANVVKKKGKEFIEEKTGVDLSNPELTEEQLLTLKQYEMDHQEELLKIGLEEKKLTLEEKKMFLGDTQDARSMQETALKQDDKFSKRFIYYYAAFTTLCSFIYMGVITFASIPEANMHFVSTILGFMLGTLVSAIIQFFFGSSQGSKDKSDMEKSLLSKVGKGGI